MSIETVITGGTAIPVGGIDPVSVIDLQWVPVLKDGREECVSLRVALADAHEYSGFGPSLLPIERESLIRFFSSLTGVILRFTSPAYVKSLAKQDRSNRVIPFEAVNRFFDTYGQFFNLRDADKPFMQEWHIPSDSDPKQYSKDISELHLHIPGGSSSVWGLRDEKREASDPRVLALLVIMQWFHAKPNHARPQLFGGNKSIVGAPSGIGGSDATYFVMGRTLAETVLANTLKKWTEKKKENLPAYLDQDYVPSNLAQLVDNKLGIWRSTWTPNRPALLWANGAPTHFAIALTQRPIPLIPLPVGIEAGGNPVYDAAKAMHYFDCAHIWKEIQPGKKKNAPESAPLPPPFWVRAVAKRSMASTEGLRFWYHEGFDQAFGDWAHDDLHGGVRVLNRRKGDCFFLGIYIEEAGVQTPDFVVSEWHEMPIERLDLTSSQLERIELELVFDVVDGIRKQMIVRLRNACADSGSKSSNPLSPKSQRAFFGAIDQVVLPYIDHLHDGRADVLLTLSEISRVSIGSFEAATRPLLNPASTAAVESARAAFGRDVRKKVAAASVAYQPTSKPPTDESGETTI